MSDIPEDLKYTNTHEWVRVADDGSVVIGITDHAQSALGDLVFVEIPEEGGRYGAGDACAVVESVKAASDVYSPIGGVVQEANDDLSESPELINESPYEDGWIMSFIPDEMEDIEKLLDANAYRELLEEG